MCTGAEWCYCRSCGGATYLTEQGFPQDYNRPSLMYCGNKNCEWVNGQNRATPLNIGRVKPPPADVHKTSLDRQVTCYACAQRPLYSRKMTEPIRNELRLCEPRGCQKVQELEETEFQLVIEAQPGNPNPARCTQVYSAHSFRWPQTPGTASGTFYREPDVQTASGPKRHVLSAADPIQSALSSRCAQNTTAFLSTPLRCPEGGKRIPARSTASPH
ncbi:hypothetical protein DFH06DRAFT_1142841 [Mycena polygramma]|nr:hypothetical protein DFH06DRAFT_1142841 [Mycena polygramma]